MSNSFIVTKFTDLLITEVSSIVCPEAFDVYTELPFKILIKVFSSLVVSYICFRRYNQKKRL